LGESGVPPGAETALDQRGAFSRMNRCFFIRQANAGAVTALVEVDAAGLQQMNAFPSVFGRESVAANYFSPNNALMARTSSSPKAPTAAFSRN
jgi:hypothetical protein